MLSLFCKYEFCKFCTITQSTTSVTISSHERGVKRTVPTKRPIWTMKRRLQRYRSQPAVEVTHKSRKIHRRWRSSSKSNTRARVYSTKRIKPHCVQTTSTPTNSCSLNSKPLSNEELKKLLMDSPCTTLMNMMRKRAPSTLNQWVELTESLMMRCIEYVRANSEINVKQNRIEIRHRMENDHQHRKRIQVSLLLQKFTAELLSAEFAAIAITKSTRPYPYGTWYFWPGMLNVQEKGMTPVLQSSCTQMIWLNPLKLNTFIFRGTIEDHYGIRFQCVEPHIAKDRATYLCVHSVCSRAYMRYADFATHAGKHLFALEHDAPFDIQWPKSIGGICSCGKSGQMLQETHFEEHARECTLRTLIIPPGDVLKAAEMYISSESQTMKYTVGDWKQWMQSAYGLKTESTNQQQ